MTKEMTEEETREEETAEIAETAEAAEAAETAAAEAETAEAAETAAAEAETTEAAKTAAAEAETAEAAETLEPDQDMFDFLIEEAIESPQNKKDRLAPISSRLFNLEMLMLTLAVFSAGMLFWSILVPNQRLITMIVGGLSFTASLVLLVRLIMDPDSVRARQSDEVLKLASNMLSYIDQGLNACSAGKICELLLPSTPACAVAITGKERILGYAGISHESNLPESSIKTKATYATLKDGQPRILLAPEEIGFSAKERIRAAIIVPLTVGNQVEGTLKFYYRRARQVNETQKSLAQGFGKLLSTQMAAAALEQQTKLATSMELKALQSQINPHFLFNTINTIASLVRTNPEKARELLREFAVFYRRTLEDSVDMITLGRELEQVRRYFSFELARFGEDRLEFQVDIEADLTDMMVPPFLIQPLVENSVRHGMPSEGKMQIAVCAQRLEDRVIISAKDNGVGMTEEARENILHPRASSGIGIAMKNVNDRIHGCFGPGSHMEVESELGKGTSVMLVLVDNPGGGVVA